MFGSTQYRQFLTFVHKSTTIDLILVILMVDQVTWLAGFSRRRQADLIVSQGVVKSNS